MVREIDQPEGIGSQPAKTETVDVKKRQQREDRRIQDALEDDEVREALLSRARDKSG